MNEHVDDIITLHEINCMPYDRHGIIRILNYIWMFDDTPAVYIEDLVELTGQSDKEIMALCQILVKVGLVYCDSIYWEPANSGYTLYGLTKKGKAFLGHTAQ